MNISTAIIIISFIIIIIIIIIFCYLSNRKLTVRRVWKRKVKDIENKLSRGMRC